MPMTLEEFRRRFPDRPDPIPLEYAGDWVAVERDLHTVVASDEDPRELIKKVDELVRKDLILRYVPRAAYIGETQCRI